MNKDMTINELMSSLKKQFNFHYEKTQTISKLLKIIDEACEVDLQVQEVFKEIKDQEEAREFFRDYTIKASCTTINETPEEIKWMDSQDKVFITSPTPIRQPVLGHSSIEYPYLNDGRSNKRCHKLWEYVVYCLEVASTPMTCKEITDFITKETGNTWGYASLPTSIFGLLESNKHFKRFSKGNQKPSIWGLKNKNYEMEK